MEEKFFLHSYDLKNKSKEANKPTPLSVVDTIISEISKNNIEKKQAIVDIYMQKMIIWYQDAS